MKKTPAKCLLFVFIWSLIIPQELYCQSNSNFNNTDLLLQYFEVRKDANCNISFESALKDWKENSWRASESSFNYINNPTYEGCLWTKFVLVNKDSTFQKRTIYFPKYWKSLNTFTVIQDDVKKQTLGPNYGKELMTLEFRPYDTITVYANYPPRNYASHPIIGIKEIIEEDLLTTRKKERLKFFLLGIMVFPILFFLFQIFAYRERLSFYYFLFLLGSTANLITILEDAPIFEITSKLITGVRMNQLLFLFSSLFMFFGLIKFMIYLLELNKTHRILDSIANVLLFIFGLIIAIPLIRTKLMTFDYYESYLLYFRLWALILFLFGIFILIKGLILKVRFHLILLLSFAPLILTGLLYVLSFLFSFTWAIISMESIILIIGFMLTIFMFGAILGIRNKMVKDENLILEQNTKQLRELDQFKSRFYTNITHEFRTPLTLIKGMANQIKGSEKIVDSIQRNSDRLLNLINQLLDLSKIENKKISLHLINDDIIHYISYYTEYLKSWANSKKISLTFFCYEDTIRMDFDEDKIQKIIINLVSNSIHHTPQYGNIKLTVGKVERSNHEFLQIQIKDTGVGISDHDLPHIFEMFYQSNPDSPPFEINHENQSLQKYKKGSGSGIGLALVKEIVELLNGGIKVESELNMGTTFIVELPINNNLPAITDSRPEITETIIREKNTLSRNRTNTFQNNKKPQLLIIEDNLDVIDYIITCIQKDYDWKYAMDGKEGIKDAIEFIPDVIICDLMMPEVNGFEVCEHLKTDKRTSHIPIVILTAKATKEDMIHGLSLGANAFLTKPFDQEELIIRLKNLSKDHQLLVESLMKGGVDLYKNNVAKESLFLEEVNDIIEKNMENELFETMVLCKKIGMSRTQLHRKLKALTEFSTAGYIRYKRLNKAKLLLETSDLNIGEISSKVGYKDFSHFSKSFLKVFKITPSEFRK